MLKVLSILWNSFKMALQELKANKLRTFLSLFGITIGIFCIIGVLATIDSLQSKIKSDLSSFGNNSVYIDKWDYSGGPEYPWWKFVKRPSPKIAEMDFVKKKSTLASSMAFFVQTQETFTYEDNQLKGVNIYGIRQILHPFMLTMLHMEGVLMKRILIEGALMQLLDLKLLRNYMAKQKRQWAKPLLTKVEN